jgi:hypothetical protein
VQTCKSSLDKYVYLLQIEAHLASPECICKRVAEFNTGPVEARDFSLLQNVQTGSGAHPVSLFNGYRLSFPGVKRPGREVNHPPPSSPEVKNGRSYTSHRLPFS